MRRKKKGHGEAHENHERWLISYADFITLLFALFTALYSTALAEPAKIKEIEAAFAAAMMGFEGGRPSSVLDELSSVKSLDNRIGEFEGGPPARLAQIEQRLREFQGQTFSVTNNGDTLVITLPERLLFAPGSAELHPSAYLPLTKLGAAFTGSGVEVTVHGVADAAPISGNKFRDNWELASERSLTTIRFLEKQKVDRERLRSAAMVTKGQSEDDRAVILVVRTEDFGAAAELRDRIPAE
jgi:chemotaxis protein MotB